MPNNLLPSVQPNEPLKPLDFEAWFDNIIERMHKLRPSMHKLSVEQYNAFCEALKAKGGLSAGDRIVAEKYILHAKWATNKLTGVGLELSDFMPEEIKLSHAQVREMQTHLFQQARFAIEEKQREQERLRGEQPKKGEDMELEKLLKSYNTILVQYVQERNAAEANTKKAIRRAERAESDADTMRSIIAQKDAEMQEYLQAAQTVSEEEAENPELLRVLVLSLKRKCTVLKHKNDILTRELQGAQRSEEDDFDLETLFKAR